MYEVYSTGKAFAHLAVVKLKKGLVWKCRLFKRLCVVMGPVSALDGSVWGGKVE